MAYYYPPNFNMYQQTALPQYQPTVPMQQTQTTIFVNVPNEDVARRWDVSPNSTARFINENEGYFYSKSVGA